MVKQAQTIRRQADELFECGLTIFRVWRLKI